MFRRSNDKIVGGVCSGIGIAEHYEVNALGVRIVAIISVAFAGIIPIIIYAILYGFMKEPID